MGKWLVLQRNKICCCFLHQEGINRLHSLIKLIYKHTSCESCPSPAAMMKSNAVCHSTLIHQSSGSQTFYSPIPLQIFNRQLRTPSSTRVSTLSNVYFCYPCKPATNTLYKYIYCELLSQPRLVGSDKELL
jgi:hypothetical protein